MAAQICRGFKREKECLLKFNEQKISWDNWSFKFSNISLYCITGKGIETMETSIYCLL